MLVRVLIYWFCLVFSSLAVAAEPVVTFSYQEIETMHKNGIKMALEGEREPYVIPSDIKPEKLLQTETLSFANLDLRRLPPFLARFTKLRHLDLSGTNVRLPQLTPLRNMPVLENLNLSGVSLFAAGGKAEAINALWGSLTNLRILNLAQTGGTAQQYGNIGQLVNLVHLNMSHNQIAEIAPLNLASLQQLRTLDLSFNQLNDFDLNQLPPNVNELNLSNCKIKNFAWRDGWDFPQLGSLKLDNNPGLQIAPEWGDVFLMQQLVALDVDSDVTVPKGWRVRLEKIRTEEYKAACLAHNKKGQLISQRYRENCDGTVTDVTTNLMWKRCAEGQTWTGGTCSWKGTGIIWDAAMPNGQQKTWDAFAGYSDWRVPTIENLRTLVYCSSGKPKTWNDTGNSCEGDYKRPTIDTTAFPNTESTGFWSASAVASDSPLACGLHFSYGNYGNWNGHSNAISVRLVRGGQ